MTVPSFLWCLLVGLVIRNGGGAAGLRLHDAASDLIGSVCLSLFLAWTMMALDLRGVLALAGPLLVILAGQTVLVVLWATFVVFRLGRARLRERGDVGRVLRLRHGGDGHGDRQHAGADPALRPGAAGLHHRADRRRVLHRHHERGRADRLPVAPLHGRGLSVVLRLAALLLLILGLAGCGDAPGTEQVQRDLAERLAQAFDAGTFEIVSVNGRGSATDNASPPGEARRVVYYDTRLRLTRDIDFGGWNTPGVASLVTLLGAGPKGVQGAKAGGNKAGDEIFAHGTAIYRRDGGAWQEVAPAGFTLPVAPALDTISPPSASERLVAALQAVVHASPAGTTPAAQAVIDRELSRALATIQARLTRLSQGYPVAAGPEGGQYVRFVQALQATRPLGLTFQALLTAGSVENLGAAAPGRRSAGAGPERCRFRRTGWAGTVPVGRAVPGVARVGQPVSRAAAHHRSRRLARRGPCGMWRTSASGSAPRGRERRRRRSGC